MKASIKYNSILTFFKHIGSLLLIYSICRVLFYAFNYSYFTDLSIGSFIFLVFVSLRFDLSVIVLSNNSAIIPPTVVEKVANIYLEKQFTETPTTPKVDIASLPAGSPIAEADATRYAGIFTNTDLGQTFKMTIKDGKLVHTGLAKGELPVTRTADGHLVMVEGESRYEMIPVVDASGSVSQRSLHNHHMGPPGSGRHHEGVDAILLGRQTQLPGGTVREVNGLPGVDGVTGRSRGPVEARDRTEHAVPRRGAVRNPELATVDLAVLGGVE